MIQNSKQTKENQPINKHVTMHFRSGVTQTLLDKYKTKKREFMTDKSKISHEKGDKSI
tara:strand:- start:138 stop:311 length:174 start_codon:yes stop_codon:yes gene_type:complete